MLCGAIGLFELAVALDPQFVEAQIRLANSLVGRCLVECQDRRADLARAEGLVGEALT